MTYANKIGERGRQPVWIVEIDLDYCSRSYGVAPCAAAIGVTGPSECFNTRKTCQDSANYAKTIKTYRFSNVLLPASSDPQFQAIPCVEAVSMLPTKIEPGKGLGKRATLTVTFNDHAHSDLGIDPYLNGRGYDSSARGTYFTKLLSRNPYYQGRSLRVRTGYIDAGQAPDAANFEDRFYQIEKIEGPDRSGKIRIMAKDPLKALDDARALAPLPSTATLSTAMNTSIGTLTLLPAGVGNLLFPASGKVVVDEEVMTFVSRVGDVLTLVRGANGTVAAGHDANVPVQLCLSYAGAFVTDVLYDLLVTYAGVNPAYIDLASWNLEADIWLSNYDLTAVVVKPMGVAKLVGEISEQCQLFIWWDEKTQRIKLKAVRPWAFDEVATLSDEYNILADSQSVRDRPDDRISQVLVYYGQKDPTKDLEKPWNFARLKVNTDADSESADQYGDTRNKIIYSRWLSSAQLSEAVSLATRTLNRFRNTPRTIVMQLDAKDSLAWTGDVVLASMRSITDYTGLRAPSYLQVVAVKEVVVGTVYEYELEDTGFFGRYSLWCPLGIPDYLSASSAQRARHGFWSDAAGLMSDGTEGYKFA